MLNTNTALAETSYASNDNVVIDDGVTADTADSHATSQAIDDSASTPYLARTLNAIRQGASVAGLLRMGGAALMVFSLSLFLVQGVDAASDLHRYLLLLGQTLLLTAAGFAVGFILKEPRGARVFFSLGLISIPANFAVLGAMIYSIAPLDSVLTDYPTYAKWASTSLNELLIAGAAALVVLVPMCVFCFAVMARQSKGWLSAGYLLACSTLLIPVRDTLSVTLISCVCAVAVIALLAKRQSNTERQSTDEERFAKALLFAPAALLLARSAMLYDVDFHFLLAIVIAIHYGLRHCVKHPSKHAWLKTSAKILSASSAFVLAGMFGSLINSQFPFIDPFLLFASVLLALNIDLVRLMGQSRTGSVMHGGWAGLCFAAIATDILVGSAFTGSTTSLALAVLVTCASVITRQRLGAILGTLSIIGVVLVNSADLFSMVLDTGWAGMAVAGASTIVAGSLLERYWPVLKLTWEQRFGARLETNRLHSST